MRKICIVVYCITSFISCATYSGYVSYYTPLVDPRTLPNVELLREGEAPQIYSSNNIIGDSLDVESNHYIVIGYSSFNGKQESINGIKEICRRTGATFALYSNRYTGTVSNSGVMVLPNQERTTTTGNIYSNNGSAWYQSSSTTNNSLLVPYSYNVRQYDQEAVFFVKVTSTYKFGAGFVDLLPETKRLIQRNTGSFIRVIYKNTPAFYANILIGDVLIKLNGTEVFDTNHLFQLLDKYNSGDTIVVTIIRNNEFMDIKIKLD